MNRYLTVVLDFQILDFHLAILTLLGHNLSSQI